ncbi:MAG: Ig-like domain-containing protein [Candidatus Eisenbacteria bacterium]|uniref:Ig-like domain-containing protein n=1 Tax=Eiseniibacteriota bacterium TaxID=2212470 RepID=A0A933SGA9_UNCEI|nr:Ig-like domain-containing protein [Candidatus Eisenbacteria bacterium]
MRFDRTLASVTRPLAAFLLLAALTLVTGCSTSGSWVPGPNGPLLGYVLLTPTTDTLQIGGTRAFVAAALDTYSVAVASPMLEWSSSNTAVATVSSSGLVTAVSEGVAQIVAAGNGAADTATVFVYAQDGWYVQTSNTGNALNGVFFQADGRRGVAVGDAGTLLTTSNAGATWTVRTSGTSAALNSVWFTHPDTGWAVGATGVVLKSVNGGLNWSRVTVSASENLACVRFVGTRTGWIAGAGVILRTTNGGATWTRSSPTALQLNGLSFSDASNGWAAGANGVVLGTHDGGVSWYVVQPSLTSQALQAVVRRSNTAAWIVGAQGTLARTSATVDSLAWTVSSTGALHQLSGLSFVSATTGWAVGYNGTAALILATSNGGASWTPQTSIATEALNDVFFVDDQRGWAVGDGGRILHTARGGL